METGTPWPLWHLTPLPNVPNHLKGGMVTDTERREMPIRKLSQVTAQSTTAQPSPRQAGDVTLRNHFCSPLALKISSYPHLSAEKQETGPAHTVPLALSS